MSGQTARSDCSFRLPVQTVKSDGPIRLSDRPCRVYVRMWVEFKDSLMFLGGVAKIPPFLPIRPIMFTGRSRPQFVSGVWLCSF